MNQRLGTHADALRLALRLEGLTVAWMVVEAGASLAAGLVAGSTLLLAFGIDSLIELFSACLLIWRLRREARAGVDDEATIEKIERLTAQIGGYLLFALAVYVIVQAGYALWNEQAADTSWWGMAIALVAAMGTPFLARAKLRVADQIGSRALRADAIETLTCGYLAWNQQGVTATQDIKMPSKRSPAGTSHGCSSPASWPMPS
jgi:divalent metal cation (Fe/Co/Zn/Cd) transporter